MLKVRIIAAHRRVKLTASNAAAGRPSPILSRASARRAEASSILLKVNSKQFTLSCNSYVQIGARSDLSWELHVRTKTSSSSWARIREVVCGSFGILCSTPMWMLDDRFPYEPGVPTSACLELAMAVDLAGVTHGFAGAEAPSRLTAGLKAGRSHRVPANFAGKLLKRPQKSPFGISVGRLEWEAGR
jgi:hypothetical protein